MTGFLCFTLYAPVSSWGEIAVGEARGSWDRPSRSALLGLIGAALGITRDEQDAHDALDTGYGVAVRLDAPGTPMVDYHTAQTVSASAVKKRRPLTRAELLASGELETILSRRGYRQDALATVALWPRAGARWLLSQLADALRQPAFVLYAGRKANVFGLPLAPVIIEAATLADAFTGFADQRKCAGRQSVAHAEVSGIVEQLRPPDGWGQEVAHDSCVGFASGLVPLRWETRRDTAAQRRRWHFADRVLEVASLESTGGEARTSGGGHR